MSMASVTVTDTKDAQSGVTVTLAANARGGRLALDPMERPMEGSTP